MAKKLFMYRYDDSRYGTQSFGYGMKHTSMDSMWTSADTKRAVLFSLVPGALSLCAASSFRKEKNLSEWWTASKKPNWVPENPAIYGLVDTAAIAPVGLASYMAFKYGGGFAHFDTTLALGLYAGSMICALCTVPLVKRKNYRYLFGNTLLMHLTGLGAAITFYKIDHKAGLLLVPYALLTGFYTYLMYTMNKMNASEAKTQ